MVRDNRPIYQIENELLGIYTDEYEMKLMKLYNKLETKEITSEAFKQQKTKIEKDFEWNKEHISKEAYEQAGKTFYDDERWD
ncbi:hypothetical protein BW731_08665 [Vagococcus martis]|uniref:Uncharacterized protein n=1 Tax=Vagococcus martis TaxID=1768210 RepID=A0A1V4DIC9_9ENTE|nr:hypothetical protein [Vagococcus martis]OPF88239.1 hypothetical protein BW731_08665 [Vagococcus martis]